jgi:hypothetical protein
MSDSLAPPPSPYPQQVDPSPTDSNGTENTEIEEDVQEEVTNTFPNAAVQSSRSRCRESVRMFNSSLAIAQ